MQNNEAWGNALGFFVCGSIADNIARSTAEGGSTYFLPNPQEVRHLYRWWMNAGVANLRK